MSFLWPEMLLALLLVPIYLAAYIYMQRQRQRYTVRYASLSLVRDAVGKGPGIRRHIPAALFLVALATMVFALARPTATVLLPSQQGTVILSLDVSGSMRANDLKPNRIEAAKAAARLFVGEQPKNVRIGVVSFSGGASVVQAPTVDREAVLAAIERLAPQRSTAIGAGILSSLDAISEDPTAKPTPVTADRDSLSLSQPTPTASSRPRGSNTTAVVVLLSDGQNTTGPRPLDAAKEASNRGIRVFTVGMGSPEGVVLNVEGRSARVRLDEETLKRVAEETGGEYYRAESENSLREIYQKLSTELVLKPEQTEVTAIVTGVAMALLLLAGAFSLRWFSRLP